MNISSSFTLIKNNNIFRIKYNNDIIEIINDNKNKIIICYYYIKENEKINNELLKLCNEDNNIIILLINICEYETNLNNELIITKIPYVKIINDINNNYKNIINDLIFK